MLRERSRVIMMGHIVLDICLSVFSFLAAYGVRMYFYPTYSQGLFVRSNYYIVLLMLIIIWYITFNFFNLYAPYREQKLIEILWNMIKAVCTSMLILIICLYLFKITNISRIMMGLFFLLNIGLLGLSKGIAYKILTRYRQKGFNFRNIIIVGSREGAKEVISAIGDHLETGFRVLGCLEVNQDKVGTIVKNGISVISTIDKLEKILREQVVDELIFSMPLRKINQVEKYIDLAEKFGLTIRILPQWHIQQIGYKPRISSIHIEEFLGLYTMALSTVPYEHTKLLLKTVIDYGVAFAILIPSLPFFLVICIAIKLSSKGPVFFKQERLGCNGRKFMLYKFRTMIVDAEKKKVELESLNEMEGPVFKIKKDPRIVPYVGTFLRKTGFDELPQLINVLKGEMSLIGPRPPIQTEVEKYDVWQRRRLSMKPGLTCLWQCSPNRNDVCFEDWINLDLNYIDNWSLGLDLKILVKTAWVVLRGMGR